MKKFWNYFIDGLLTSIIGGAFCALIYITTFMIIPIIGTLVGWRAIIAFFCTIIVYIGIFVGLASIGCILKGDKK